jgi:hypothetical protein
MPHHRSPDHGSNDHDGDNQPSLALPSSRGLDHRTHLRVKDNGVGHYAEFTDLERCEVPPVAGGFGGAVGNRNAACSMG